MKEGKHVTAWWNSDCPSENWARGQVLDWVNNSRRSESAVDFTVDRLGMKHRLICNRFLPYCSYSGGKALEESGRTYIWNSPLTFPADVLAVSHGPTFTLSVFTLTLFAYICLWYVKPYNISGSLLILIITVMHSNGFLEINHTIFTGELVLDCH